MPFGDKSKKTQSQDAQPSSATASPLFIGRTGELLFFVHNILKPETPTHNILSISGQGGIGKSTLLSRFIAIAHEAPFQDYCVTASVDERQATPISMMQKLAQQLHLTGTFEKALKQYKEAVRKQQAEQETLRETLFKGVPDVAGA